MNTTIDPVLLAVLSCVVEEMHRHVVGAIASHHGREPASIPVRLVAKWVTDFDAILGRL